MLASSGKQYKAGLLWKYHMSDIPLNYMNY
jgi:hypothetical protein